ncbi:hypothetical protein U2T19_003960 [Salmonella enterica]|nr:hypothetical protein [Salmonella enterica]ECF8134202.1 hypothetical protein [Salmonella enterica]EGI1954742.1 hypothetical protein [Salmonella enterica]EMA3597676.1 hypothetical protein [Salmonella enterica]
MRNTAKESTDGTFNDCTGSMTSHASNTRSDDASDRSADTRSGTTTDNISDNGDNSTYGSTSQPYGGRADSGTYCSTNGCTTPCQNILNDARAADILNFMNRQFTHICSP